MSTLREEIKAVILHELRQTEVKGTVVCLSGAWGCGKTHLWKEIVSDLCGDSERVVGYVSLFGIANLTEARTAVFNALVVDRFARNSGDAKKMAVRLGAWFTQKLPMTFAGLVNSRLGAEILTRNLDMSRLIPDGSILCLDDLERISDTFPLRDALGYANHLAEQRDCRVLLIMNEEHLDPRFGTEQASLIRAYRERVVRSYLRLETKLSEALPHLRTPRSLKPAMAGLAIETLEKANCTNLRTLIRALENIGRAQDLADVELEDEEIRFLTALTAEHAAGKLNEDPTYYDFHPVVFDLDERLKHPEDAEKKAFYKAYFDGASYRPEQYLHGLVRNGYLAVQLYLNARNERINPPPTVLGRLMRRIADGDHRRLSDEEAASWLAETTRVLTDDETALSGDKISTLYTVASVVAQIAGIEVGPAILNASESALLLAARRGDTSLIDHLRVASDTRLPPQLMESYRKEVARVSLDNFRMRAMDAILANDVERCRATIRAGLPETAENFLEATILQELHATLAKDRRFYFEVLSLLNYIVGEYHVVAARDRLVAYTRAVLDGTIAQFLGRQASYPAPDKSARFQLQNLLRLLGHAPDAAPTSEKVAV